MKKILCTIIILVCFFSLTAFQCNEDESGNYEEELAELNQLKTDIETLAQSSVCNENETCKYIAFGSKACGGPKSYLLYSTSISTEKLENLVSTYNQKESDFNTKWDVLSDCSYVNPPTSIICENNNCVAVY
ncbi:hypothetical protein [Neotamlana nanhaiensis]|uniref:hypothetical protein n=1 Tax=Neotamlana nanhaiensis TaxID=1382798 RepID=UPI00069BDF79|nr:hypothetical protein [Tamlana nanhaiensis]